MLDNQKIVMQIFIAKMFMLTIMRIKQFEDKTKLSRKLN